MTTQRSGEAMPQAQETAVESTKRCQDCFEKDVQIGRLRAELAAVHDSAEKLARRCIQAARGSR